MNFPIFYKILILCSFSYLFLNSAEARSCDKRIINKYVSEIVYQPAKSLCGSDLNLLLIKLNKISDNDESTLGSLSLDVKNSDDNSITRYSLNLPNSGKNNTVTACLNPDYIENSLIIFSITREESKHSLNSSNLSFRKSHNSCNLQSIVSNT